MMICNSHDHHIQRYFISSHCRISMVLLTFLVIRYSEKHEVLLFGRGHIAGIDVKVGLMLF